MVEARVTALPRLCRSGCPQDPAMEALAEKQLKQAVMPFAKYKMEEATAAGPQVHGLCRALRSHVVTAIMTATLRNHGCRLACYRTVYGATAYTSE